MIFTRPNYEKFLKVAGRELPEGMTLLRPEDIRGGKVFYDFTTRIIYDNSRVHEDNEQMQFYEGKLNHIWVDLFIIDRLPESRFGAFFAKFLQKVVYGMAIATGIGSTFPSTAWQTKSGWERCPQPGGWFPCRCCSAFRQPWRPRTGTNGPENATAAIISRIFSM